MQTTNKYNKIFTDPENAVPLSSPVTETSQQTFKSDVMDREILITEIKAMIAKAYLTDEPNNLQSKS